MAAFSQEVGREAHRSAPVPDVVGRQRQDARAALEAAGFTVQEEAILGGFFGTVRQTDPAAGTMLKKGSVVTITIV